MLVLFWRIPKTDYTFDRFFQESEIYFKDGNGQKIMDMFNENRLKEDSTYRKLARAFIVTRALRDFNRYPDQVYTQLFDKGRDLFLIGDYPIVFKKPPTTFDDLFHTDYYLPISSKRIYCKYENECELEFDSIKTIRLNTIIIDQSVRYICSPNKEFLAKSIEHYKAAKRENKILFCKDSLFN